MICRYATLSRYPSVFLKMTGLRLAEFEELLTDVLPRFASAQQQRLKRPDRQRAAGAGRHADLAATNQILLALIWLRQYPTNEVLGFLFGVSDSTASRVRTQCLPVLEQPGKDTMRMPDPGTGRRKRLPALLKDTPGLAVVVDSFE